MLHFPIDLMICDGTGACLNAVVIIVDIKPNFKEMNRIIFNDANQPVLTIQIFFLLYIALLNNEYQLKYCSNTNYTGNIYLCFVTHFWVCKSDLCMDQISKEDIGNNK